ncbi:phage recombination protein Bet [Euryhalocaulis caribicus]|uniref:phage recombination protein Bet n=1 Tax=Euryhalocaulis caribicus TaxID=1161401 RepID=UPI00039ED6DD|nr:phage recombination protein Bet [Euryhalocaulis caribicus]
MNALSKPSEYSSSQLALIKRTAAAGLTDDEFSLFIELCRRNRLDPFRGEASAIVFSAKSQDKRRVALVVGIDGLRKIADRQDTYAPDEQPPEYEYDDSLKGPTNPLGIVKCTVYVNKLRKGRWFRTPGVAYWDEFCPVVDEWAYDQQAGKRKPTGKKMAGGKWGDMPRHMIAIAAERQALRKGWPDAFGDLYAEEEVERSETEPNAAEAVKNFEKQERLEAMGGANAIMFQFDPNGDLERVPVGKVADRIMAHIEDCGTFSELKLFEQRNRHSLREFWANSQGDALEVRKALDAKLTSLAPVNDDADEPEAAEA